MNDKGQGRRTYGVLYSGGKDSTYACQKIIESGTRVACLITIASENKDSYMLHTPNIELTSLCSEAMGIPLVWGRTKGTKEVELEDIRRTILEAKDRFGIEGIASGAIASEYQKSRIESISSSCGLSVLSPFWHVNQTTHLQKLVEEKYRFVLTKVSCEGLGPQWLGREIDQESILELEQLSRRYGFNVAFEGGEAESLVIDCPLFKSRLIRIEKSSVEWNGYYGSLRVEEAFLVEK